MESNKSSSIEEHINSLSLKEALTLQLIMLHDFEINEWKNLNLKFLPGDPREVWFDLLDKRICECELNKRIAN